MSIETIATAIAALGLFFTGYQIRHSSKIARGEFLLHLDEMFQQHQEVHVRLRPGGKWANGNAGPVGNEEWASVDRYMGLFERVNVLVGDGIVDIDTIERLYGYRVSNIAANEVIVQAKLVKERKSWQDFIELQQRIVKVRQDRSKWRYRLLRRLGWI